MALNSVDNDGQRIGPNLWQISFSGPRCRIGKSLRRGTELRVDAGAIASRIDAIPAHRWKQDGVQAVPVYETASACFRAGGDAASARLAEDAAQFLRREMADDFRTRRVRLEHALNTQDYVSAQKEVRTLLNFVEGKQGEWVTWLQNLDRQLKLKVGTERKT